VRRSPTIQNIAWIVNLHRNKQLDLNPVYQRHSVWNLQYKEFFIDSILNELPSPAVFLYREMDDAGNATYHVVDGRQRIETILQFTGGELPVPDSYAPQAGKYFADLPVDLKRQIWDYPLAVEIVPEVSEAYLREIFDRINRNVAQLKPQELRHAKFSGAMISLAETLAADLTLGFPNISQADRRRMRDVEYVSVLLMFLMDGPKSTGQAEIDAFYSDYDAALPADTDLAGRYRAVQGHISAFLADAAHGDELRRSRFRNYADYYSLFGAVARHVEQGHAFNVATAVGALLAFVARVEAVREEQLDEAADPSAAAYYEAVRSASNDAGPRSTRIDIVADILNAAI
jgi:hypothetical protein